MGERPLEPQRVVNLLLVLSPEVRPPLPQLRDRTSVRFGMRNAPAFGERGLPNRS